MRERLTSKEPQDESPFTRTFRVEAYTWLKFIQACGEEGLDPYQILRNCVYNYARIYFEEKEELDAKP